MASEIAIRDERDEDVESIHQVTTAAFASSEFGHNGEAELVSQLRHYDDRISLVATYGNELVGHILFSPAQIRTGDVTLTGFGLAPLSVKPKYQNRGIGSSLVKEGVARAFETLSQFVLVLGHTPFYSRFGFTPAADFGIRHGFAGIPQDVFCINTADKCKLELITGGLAFYAAEFGAQHEC